MAVVVSLTRTGDETTRGICPTCRQEVDCDATFPFGAHEHGDCQGGLIHAGARVLRAEIPATAAN